VKPEPAPLLKKQLSAREAALVCAALLLVGGLAYAAVLGVRAVLHKRAVAAAVPNVLAALRAQRGELQQVIAGYKAHYGFYPPMRSKLGERGVHNPLFYELAGTRYDPQRKSFYVANAKEPIAPETIAKYFNMTGFTNNLLYPDWPTNFLSQRLISNNEFSPGAEMHGLYFFNESLGDDLVDDFDISTWRYTTAPAEHNPGKFDIWVEMQVQGQRYLLGNWPEAQ
jgi:hypothetical protein